LFTVMFLTFDAQQSLFCPVALVVGILIVFCKYPEQGSSVESSTFIINCDKPTWNWSTFTAAVACSW